VTARHAAPPELTGFAVLVGEWIADTPGGGSVLAETSLPRYLVQLPLGTRRPSVFLDFGQGTQVENVAYGPSPRNLFAVAAVTSPHYDGRAVVARALLEIDGDQWLLLRAMPLDRDAFARGMAVDRRLGRAFLLDDDGVSGVIRVIDLYQDRVIAETRVGAIPASLHRKGLALGRDDRSVFCAVGGAPENDFAPVGEDAPSPTLLKFASEDLTPRGELALPEGFEPRGLAYDEPREHVVVLVTDYRHSRIIIVDAGFLSVRSVVELPEDTTDLVLSGNYAFAPGAHGVYIVDLLSETWISRPAFDFEQTGEIVVSEDQRLAMVQFHSTFQGLGPGVAVVDLTTGQIQEILN
jgi:hypothetical protein